MSDQQAGPELDARVAEKVMGGADMVGFLCPRCGSNYFGSSQDGMRYCHGEHRACGWSGQAADAVPPFTTDPAADYKVLQHVREHWPDEAGDKWERFSETLWERLVERRKYGWNLTFDSHGLYEPGDYSLAALAVMEDTE